jgi:MarR family transcriptional regulator, organic hydroperoxide resistance regulator
VSTPHSTTDREPTGIDDQLCYALVSASRAMTACYRKGLAEIGLTYSQYTVMLVLWQEGTVSMSSLCDQLHLDSGTLSPLLKRLEKQGRITRRRTPEDERALEITCTDEGRGLTDQARAVQGQVERATGMSGDELADLRGQVNRLAAQLRGAVPDPG